MRFTKTWSPISRVFSIELEGISNACTTKVMMNNPVNSTAASDARNSTVVSRGFSSTSSFTWLSLTWLSFFATLSNPSLFSIYLAAQRVQSTLIHHAQSAVPTRDLKNVRDRIGKV